jgi:hypothetical protein
MVWMKQFSRALSGPTVKVSNHFDHKEAPKKEKKTLPQI